MEKHSSHADQKGQRLLSRQSVTVREGFLKKKKPRPNATVIN